MSDFLIVLIENIFSTVSLVTTVSMLAPVATQRRRRVSTTCLVTVLCRRILTRVNSVSAKLTMLIVVVFVVEAEAAAWDPFLVTGAMA